MKAEVTSQNFALRGFLGDAFMALTCFILIAICFLELISVTTGDILAGAVILAAILLPTKHKSGYSPLKILLLTFYLFLIAGVLINNLFRPELSTATRQYSLIAFFSLALGLYLVSAFAPQKIRSHEMLIERCKTKHFIYFIIALGVGIYVFLILSKGIPVFSSNPNYARLDFFHGSGHLALFFHALAVASLALLFDAEGRANKTALIASHLFAIFVFICNMLIGGRGVALANIIAYLMAYSLLKRKTVNPLYLVLSAGIGLLFMTVIGSLRRFGYISINTMLFELAVILTARPEAPAELHR